MQAFVEGEVGGLLVPPGRRLPEPPAVAPHVPVAELVHEGLDRPPRREHVVPFQRLRRLRHRAVQQRQRPAVDLRALGEGDVIRQIDAVELRVHHEERIGVPPGVDEPGGDVAHELHGDALLHLRRDPARQIPAQGVRADVVEDVVGVDDVALRLRHLPAVLVHDVGEADAVAVRHAVRHQRGDRVQGVEPAAGLVDGLADVVGGKAALEEVPVLEGVVELRVGHRPRIEPAVDDLRHAPVGAPVVRMREGDPVHGRAVQIDPFEAPPAQRFELRHRADAHEVALAVGPHRQGRAPEALPRERPVDVVREPVPEAPLPDRLRHPVDGAVERHHAVAEPARLDVPGVLGVVDEGVAGAPSVRIVVPVALGAVQESALFEQGDEDGVRVLEELPGHRLDLGQEAAVEPDPVHHRQALRPAQPDVVLAVGRRAVHDAGAVLDGHEVRRPHPADRPLGREEVERADVAHPFQRRALDPLLDGVRPHRAGPLPGDDQSLDLAVVLAHVDGVDVPQHRAGQRLGEDQGLAPAPAVVHAHMDVVDVGVYREREVRRQGPRGGGPYQERRAFGALDREAHDDRRVLDLPVPECDLVR